MNVTTYLPPRDKGELFLYNWGWTITFSILAFLFVVGSINDAIRRPGIEARRKAQDEADRKRLEQFQRERDAPPQLPEGYFHKKGTGWGR